MKVIEILLLIILIPFSTAVNLSIDYPKNVFSSQEFFINVSLSNNTENLTFDIKIDITNEEGDRISRIFNGEKFISTMYYLQEALRTENSFLLKLEGNVGKKEMIVKLRDKNKKIKVFGPFEINILEREMNESVSLEEGESEEEIFEEEIRNQENETMEKNEKINERTIILSNTKTFKEDKSKNIDTKYIFYILGIILVGIYLFKTKKEKRKNEWS